MTKSILATILCLSLIAADKNKDDATDPPKPIKRDKEEFASIATAQEMARFNGKHVVLIRYGEFTCDGSMLSQVKGSVRCWQPKGEGKERLCVMVWHSASQAWRHRDLETKPASAKEIEAVVAALQQA
jgi:hypothetical protein